MNRKIISISALAFAASYPALAADLPSRQFVPQPVYAKPAFSWTGPAIGVFAGSAQNRSRSRFDYHNTDADVRWGSAGDKGVPVFSRNFNAWANGIGPDSTRPSIDSAMRCTDGSNSNSDGNDCYSEFPLFTVDSFSTGGGFSRYLVGPASRLDAAAPLVFNTTTMAGTIGIELGYLKQYGNLVVGAVGDATFFFGDRERSYGSTLGSFTFTESWDGRTSVTNPDADLTASSSGTVSRLSSGSSLYEGSMRVSPTWLSTARLTAGVAQNRLLVFASGGVAFGNVSSAISSRYQDRLTSHCFGAGSQAVRTENEGPGGFNDDGVSAQTQVACGPVDAVAAPAQISGANMTPTNSSGSLDPISVTENSQTDAAWSRKRNAFRMGWTLGGGLAYAATDNIIIKAEGYYYNLGTVKTTVTGSSTTTTTGGGTSVGTAAPYTVRTRVDGVVGRIGVSYKF